MANIGAFNEGGAFAGLGRGLAHLQAHRTPAERTPRRVKPAEAIEAKRKREANGRPVEEAADTIGRLWCWDFLDGARFEGDLLRDAGRRYAGLYWPRWGMASAKSGGYRELVSGSGASVADVVADDDLDARLEARYLARDAALKEIGAQQGLGRVAKALVDEVCVDNHGDNDPAWLADLMAGYPEHTEPERQAMLRAEVRYQMARGKDEKRKAKRAVDDAGRAFRNAVRKLRVARVPHERLRLLREALCVLVEIDHSEGLHRRRDARVKLTDIDDERAFA